MQALLTAFAARSFPVAMTADGARVTILDESLGFAVVEDTKQVDHRISFTEQKLIDRGAGSHVPKTDSVPAGTLALVITNVSQVRQRWSETPDKPLESLLNKFLVGLIRAALGVKKQRADAERREQARLEEERKRLEEARRQAELDRRWRDEQGKVQRLEQFAAVWRRNRELRQISTALRDALGPVEAASELGEWLAWLDDHVEGSDPMRHLRTRRGRTLTVYYHGWDRDRVMESGFTDTNGGGYGNERPKFGVELTCRPSTSSYGGNGLKLELSEEFLGPYEWAQPTDWLWREFRVPAAVLNRELGIVSKDDGVVDDR